MDFGCSKCMSLDWPASFLLFNERHVSGCHSEMLLFFFLVLGFVLVVLVVVRTRKPGGLWIRFCECYSV